jgi:alpha-N-arabinofuranosidase
MEFLPGTDREKAGLLVFQNETHFYFLCKSLRGGVPVVELHASVAPHSSPDGMELITSRMLTETQKGTPLRLKIEARGDTYAFSYASGKENWRLLRDGVPASFLSTKVAGGFVGCVYAMYATSLGARSSTRAYFDWFEYVGDDEVYR